MRWEVRSVSHSLSLSSLSRFSKKQVLTRILDDELQLLSLGLEWRWSRQSSTILNLRFILSARHPIIHSTLIRLYVISLYLSDSSLSWANLPISVLSIDFELSPSLPSDISCSFPRPICTATNYDTFALSITIWAGLQLTWTVVLLGVQVWQICKQVTTLEVSNLGRYGYMGGKVRPTSSPWSLCNERW